MNRLIPLVVIVLVLLLGANSTLYVVKETERAVKLRFGKLVEGEIKPGLHVKMPFADTVRKFDARVLTMDAAPESFYTSEKKRLIVDAFAKWRIADVDTFYKTSGGIEEVVQNRLANRVNDGLRNQFGSRTLHEVVSGERDQMLKEITALLNKDSRETLGIEVIDVRVKRIDLPSEVSEPVYRRMTSEREKEARELRSKGKEKAEKIRAAADREKTVLTAQAYNQAEQLRGEGDAQAAAIYAAAYGKDAEFYSFTRSLSAYKKSFKDKNDVMLIDPKSDFFRYFNDSKAGK